MTEHRTERLLVVDDNVNNRDVLTRRLTRLGYNHIDQAADGALALAAVRDAAASGKSYDVVLLDIMMPVMNGLEVLSALAVEEVLARPSVIMISAATEIDTVVRCIELGAEDYLPKPFNPVLLQARLNTVLEKKRLRDELRRQVQRFERELAEARWQQLRMVPDRFPQPTSDGAVTVHAEMHPAREVGGDLYDCFEAAASVLCIAVGDVSDKGVPAALFMARTRSLLRASALQHAAETGSPPLPSQLAAVMNEELCKNNPAGMFVTLFVGFLQQATGRLVFVNAGHPRPYRLSGTAAVREIETRPDPPLGVMEGLVHKDHVVVLERGEALVVMTDGLPEMTDPAGSFYSDERIMADLDGLRTAAPDVITRTLVGKVQAFAAGMPAADDVTVLALRRL